MAAFFLRELSWRAEAVWIKTAKRGFAVFAFTAWCFLGAREESWLKVATCLPLAFNLPEF